MDELKEQYMTTQFIVVRYGDEQFGIDIKYVDNIVRMQRITRCLLYTSPSPRDCS